MTKNPEKVLALSKASPRDMPAQELMPARSQFLGEPALLAHESREDYLALRNEFFTELKPQGALEAQFIEDVLYYIWDIRRLRQARNEMISIQMAAVGGRILGKQPRADPESENFDPSSKIDIATSRLIKSAVLRDRQAFEKVEQLLATVKATWAELHATAFAQILPQLERIDRLMDRAERSRQSVLKDFQFLQATKAIALERRSDQAIEDPPVDVIEEHSS